MTQPHMTEGSDLLTTPQAAAMLGRNPQVLADWRHQKRGPRYIKIEKAVRYRRSDIEQYLEDRTVDPATQQ